ncbi:MAG: endonuclease/exonuclease/phosphatase family protein [Acidimicrobiia bacterium]|nr:endonuclease/exonuclease/phosphatase family protein [Acidimicrobiia bacterium]
MRLASYNVENLFDRAKVMNLGDWSKGKPVLDAFATLNGLLGEHSYTDARKKKIAALMIELGLEKSDKGPFVLLRRNRGSLLKRQKSGGIEITASGRDDWTGSLELRPEPIDHVAIQNTARVIDEVGADVLAVVEAENRTALLAFNDDVVSAVGGTPYEHVMLIDGNDDRGIDVGLLTRNGFPIGNMRSHVDDRDSRKQRVFSRDCPEYSITTPSGTQLVVLINHLKSKGFGSQARSSARRKAQAERVAEIYKQLIAGGVEHVAVVGDLNDSPDSGALAPLLAETKLKDISVHPKFDNGGYPGTYGSCKAKTSKIDYILLSPALWAKVDAGGVCRKGMWPGVRPVKWEVLESLEEESQIASDHAAIWCDLQV